MRFNKQSFGDLSSHLSRLVAQASYVVLIERFMVVRSFLLVILLLVSLWAVVALLYLDSSGNSHEGAPRSVDLNTSVIDELEVWLESRQSELESPVMTGSREYFKE